MTDAADEPDLPDDPHAEADEELDGLSDAMPDVDDDAPSAVQQLRNELGDHDPGDDHAGPKPVLWIGLTDYGRGVAPDEHIEEVAARVKDAVGPGYRVVVADDTVRILGEDEVAELLREIAGGA